MSVTKRETAGNSPPPWLPADEALRRDCDCHTYRASGPGRKKRNVTESAVRQRHRPNSDRVVATESRSQAENRRRALRPLRLALAVAQRRPAQVLSTETRARVIDGGGRFAVNVRDPKFPELVAAVLDHLEANDGRTGATAETFGTTSSQLVRFLRRENIVWAEANRIRGRHGQSVLR